jgi:hypothetical protein
MECPRSCIAGWQASKFNEPKCILAESASLSPAWQKSMTPAITMAKAAPKKKAAERRWEHAQIQSRPCLTSSQRISLARAYGVGTRFSLRVFMLTALVASICKGRERVPPWWQGTRLALCWLSLWNIWRILCTIDGFSISLHSAPSVRDRMVLHPVPHHRLAHSLDSQIGMCKVLRFLEIPSRSLLLQPGATCFLNKTRVFPTPPGLCTMIATNDHAQVVCCKCFFWKTMSIPTEMDPGNLTCTSLYQLCAEANMQATG